MFRKLTLVTAILLSFSLLLSGCNVTSADLMADVEAAQWPENPPELDREFNESVRQFSWDLFMLTSSGQGNVMVSPASVYIALAMALNGADTQTRDDMLDTLAAYNLSVEDINTNVRDWITLLTRDEAKTEVAIANSIWYREGFTPDRDFLQSNADYIGAAARSLDFSDSGAVQTINNWIKEATRDTIDEIVERIDADVMMYLINALYFKSDWQTQFAAEDTVKGIFNAPSGSVNVDYMNRQDQMEYFKSEFAQGVILPYTDDRFAFVALLPDAEITPTQLIARMSENSFTEILGASSGLDIDLYLPKFEASYEASLKNDLSVLGMEIAFDPSRADFSLMQENRSRDLYISEVKHKTYIKVDEKGTEAAAVTSIEMRATGMPAAGYELRFDRPFIYALIDVESGLPLFLGIMENPQSQ